jgi:hypothetical protein
MPALQSTFQQALLEIKNSDPKLREMPFSQFVGILHQLILDASQRAEIVRGIQSAVVRIDPTLRGHFERIGDPRNDVFNELFEPTTKPSPAVRRESQKVVDTNDPNAIFDGFFSLD